MSQSEHIELEIQGEERVRLLLPCLLSLEIGHTLYFARNGREPFVVAQIRPQDDDKLLRLWDEITDLRMRYLEARQAERVVQLSYLEGSEEVVVL